MHSCAQQCARQTWKETSENHPHSTVAMVTDASLSWLCYAVEWSTWHCSHPIDSIRKSPRTQGWRTSQEFQSEDSTRVFCVLFGFTRTMSHFELPHRFFMKLKTLSGEQYPNRSLFGMRHPHRRPNAWAKDFQLLSNDIAGEY